MKISGYSNNKDKIELEESINNKLLGRDIETKNDNNKNIEPNYINQKLNIQNNSNRNNLYENINLINNNKSSNYFEENKASFKVIDNNEKIQDNYNINKNNNILNNVELSNGNNNNGINIYKIEINKLTQENNSLKAKIIDIEQILSKYKEENNKYNSYINICYNFFNNITNLGLNNLGFDINQYNNKLMNLIDFKDKFSKIENYFVLLKKNYII